MLLSVFLLDGQFVSAAYMFRLSLLVTGQEGRQDSAVDMSASYRLGSTSGFMLAPHT